MSATTGPTWLKAEDRDALLQLLETDRPASLYLRSLVHEYGVTPTPRLEHGRFVAAHTGDRITAVLFMGNSRNLTTMGDDEQITTLLDHALDMHNQPRLFVGPSEHAGTVRRALARHGARPFLDREQTYYVLTPATLTQHEPIAVRPAEAKDLNRVARAQAAMTEEDLAIPRKHLDMERLRELSQSRIALRKVWLVEESGELVFKTEESARAPDGILVGGVFTEPAHRGKGLATRAIAAWADILFSEGLESIALHVNAKNKPAVAAYERVGFKRYASLRLMLAY